MPKSPDHKERTERQAAEGKVAMAEYLSEFERFKKRTAELRELRLAKEAEEQEVPKTPLKKKRRLPR